MKAVVNDRSVLLVLTCRIYISGKKTLGSSEIHEERRDCRLKNQKGCARARDSYSRFVDDTSGGRAITRKKNRRRCDGWGSGQRPSSHMYLYQKTLCAGCVWPFWRPKERKRDYGAASEGRQERQREIEKGKKERRPRASRDALAAASNDSGNSIPVGSRGEPRASR